MLFVAEHESGFGTKRPFYACRRMSVHGGKAVVQSGLREHS